MTEADKKRFFVVVIPKKFLCSRSHIIKATQKFGSFPKKKEKQKEDVGWNV